MDPIVKTSTIPETIKKAFDGDDWEHLKYNHHLNYKNAVDHSKHTKLNTVPKSYANFLNDPKPTVNSNGLATFGESAKTIHDLAPHLHPEDKEQLQSSVVMTKPYHQKIDPKLMHYGKMPISGWATMATKALFNAGGIGHLAENVHATEHQGMPVTAHFFASRDFRPVASTIRREAKAGRVPSTQPHLGDLSRIAVMDYLSNNIERHGNNLLVGAQNPHTGKHNVLAIDHERNFQYNNPIHFIDYLNRKKKDPGAKVQSNHESPRDYVDKSTGMRDAMWAATHQATPDDHRRNSEDVRQWWNQNGEKIRHEMQNQLGAIKDSDYRNHISHNFSRRWDAMNEWAKEGNRGLFEEGSVEPVESKPLNYKVGQAQEIESRLSHMAPHEAARSLLRIANDNRDHWQVIDNVFDKLSRKMSPDELSSLLMEHYDHPTVDVKGRILASLPHDKRTEVIESLREKMKSMPEASRAIFPFLNPPTERRDDIPQDGTVKVA